MDSDKDSMSLKESVDPVKLQQGIEKAMILKVKKYTREKKGIGNRGSANSSKLKFLK